MGKCDTRESYGFKKIWCKAYILYEIKVIHKLYMYNIFSWINGLLNEVNVWFYKWICITSIIFI